MRQYESLPIPSPEGRQFATLDIVMFFHRELVKLCRDFGYSEKQYRTFLSWHQPGELVNKLDDPERFFRIVRDEEGKIIAYMESRLTDRINRTHTIQWIYIADEHKRTGVSKKLWVSFFEYCTEHHIRSLRSFVKVTNSPSINMHEALGFRLEKTNNGDALYFLLLSQ